MHLSEPSEGHYYARYVTSRDDGSPKEEEAIRISGMKPKKVQRPETLVLFTREHTYSFLSCLSLNSSVGE